MKLSLGSIFLLFAILVNELKTQEPEVGPEVEAEEKTAAGQCYTCSYYKIGCTANCETDVCYKKVLNNRVIGRGCGDSLYRSDRYKIDECKDRHGIQYCLCKGELCNDPDNDSQEEKDGKSGGAKKNSTNEKASVGSSLEEPEEGEPEEGEPEEGESEEGKSEEGEPEEGESEEGESEEEYLEEPEEEYSEEPEEEYSEEPEEEEAK
ncbi:hypothetical protein SNEBB_006968 [Seison nebaliae]|nr:hypothetical protein SNEBB_006968 [Seison nebaliae]